MHNRSRLGNRSLRLSRRLLSTACFREISGTLLNRVATAMSFGLHGAAAADSEDDPAGDFLEKVRTDLGYRGRVVLSLDLYANFIRRMLRHIDAGTAYRTFPHMAFTATGERTVRLALHPRRSPRSPP